MKRTRCLHDRRKIAIAIVRVPNSEKASSVTRKCGEGPSILLRNQLGPRLAGLDAEPFHHRVTNGQYLQGCGWHNGRHNGRGNRWRRHAGGRGGCRRDWGGSTRCCGRSLGCRELGRNRKIVGHDACTDRTDGNDRQGSCQSSSPTPLATGVGIRGGRSMAGAGIPMAGLNPGVFHSAHQTVHSSTREFFGLVS